MTPPDAPIPDASSAPGAMPGQKYRRPFQADVLTPEGRLCSMEVTSAVFPASDGLVGVLGGRGPMVALVGAGPLDLHPLRGDVAEYYVAGGFAHMLDNHLVVLAEECQRLADLDREEVWEEIQRARRLPMETDEQVRRREERIAVARTKFALVQRYLRRTQGPAAAGEADHDRE